MTAKEKLIQMVIDKGLITDKYDKNEFIYLLHIVELQARLDTIKRIKIEPNGEIKCKDSL